MMKYYIFQDKHMLVQKETHALPTKTIWNSLAQLGALAHIFTETHYAYAAASFATQTAPPKTCEHITIREYFAAHDEAEVFCAARAKSLLNWRTSHLFCPACGTLLKDDKKLIARNCTSCNTQYFPRIEPCIIVLVTRGNELLLARHKERNQNIYTCIAGFIEAGESAEQAVVREVHEEVGVEIQNVRYVGSQSWPFPDQLMLGFRAEYKSGTIRVQEDELYEARWFPRNALPPFPKQGSMGWRLISGAYG
ncbi:MAG: NAD(+) diphosphatase [Treponema sp.]|nr:NAD(+) diphosphatase [Treponema sp.]